MQGILVVSTYRAISAPGRPPMCRLHRRQRGCAAFLRSSIHAAIDRRLHCPTEGWLRPPIAFSYACGRNTVTTGHRWGRREPTTRGRSAARRRREPREPTAARASPTAGLTAGTDRGPPPALPRAREAQVDL